MEEKKIITTKTIFKLSQEEIENVLMEWLGKANDEDFSFDFDYDSEGDICVTIEKVTVEKEGLN